MATKTAAISGATSALGQAVAKELLHSCAQEQTSLHLFLVARNESRMNEVADDLRSRGAKITSIVCDLDALDEHSGLVDTLKSVKDYWFFLWQHARACVQEVIIVTRYIPLIIFTVLTNFSSQIMLKHGMTSISKLELSPSTLIPTMFSVVFNPWVFAGLSMMVISMGSHLLVLSRVEISFAYPFLGLSSVLITL